MLEWVVIDICNSSSGHYHQQQHQQQALRGYLSTPSYPQPYSNTADCTANLTAPHRGQRVRLYVVDLQLETAGAGCADWLHVFDGLKSVTLCGKRARRLLATSARQQLQVRFHSNQQRRLKGFWLYYEGTDRTSMKQRNWSVTRRLLETTHFVYYVETAKDTAIVAMECE